MENETRKLESKLFETWAPGLVARWGKGPAEGSSAGFLSNCSGAEAERVEKPKLYAVGPSILRGSFGADARDVGL